MKPILHVQAARERRLAAGCALPRIETRVGFGIEFAVKRMEAAMTPENQVPVGDSSAKVITEAAAALSGGAPA